MKYSEASLGRVFVIRLEDGDIVHECIEKFAAQKNIKSAALIILGGADKTSRLVVGPEQGRAAKINPMIHTLEDVHEAAGTGTVFPDKDGRPVVHLHMTCGRKDKAVTGCVRAGVKVWQVMEAVLIEITGSSGRRLPDSATGFELLCP
jgi:predicted DNA-binding protein with PD1-like motif